MPQLLTLRAALQMSMTADVTDRGASERNVVVGQRLRLAAAAAVVPAPAGVPHRRCSPRSTDAPRPPPPPSSTTRSQRTLVVYRLLPSLSFYCRVCRRPST